MMLTYNAVFALTLRSPLDPSRAPCVSVDCGMRTLRLRVPEDDAVMEAMVAAAHSAALAAGEDEYDAVMEEHCSSLITRRPAYWAQVWPCAIALSQIVLAEPSLVAAKKCLEVGAGLAMPSVSAALAGAAFVLATDREPDAIRYALANAAENECSPQVVSAELLDWSLAGSPIGSDPAAPIGSKFDVVLCSDVLYDATAPPLLSRLLHECVLPGGCVLLTDNADRPYKDTRTDVLLELVGCARSERHTTASVRHEPIAWQSAWQCFLTLATSHGVPHRMGCHRVGILTAGVRQSILWHP